MRFPFTYHSKKDHQLVCIDLDDQYQVMNIEVWDESNQHWRNVSGTSPVYADYLSDFQEELTRQYY